MNYYSVKPSLLSSSCYSSSSSTIPHINAPKCGISLSTAAISCSIRRHYRRRRKPSRSTHSQPSWPTDQKLQMVIDTENLSNETSLSVRRLSRATHLRLSQFVHSGNEAIEDLQSLITIDASGRVIVSCHRSTLKFVSSLVLWTCLIAFGFRVLIKLGLGFWGRLGFGNANTSGLIWRRDRSLGGREVVVGRKSPWETLPKASKSRRIPENWASGVEDKKKLPSWWPVLLPPPVKTADKQKYQRMADRLIRAIMDYRINGRDISENDIIQVRQLCRMSGSKVFIDTANARDSFYRASIDLVLKVCGSAASQATSAFIDGEDVRYFIAGLADNLDLENTRAARMVSAAVAARTRSCFLQALAWEMQGKHSEALEELRKLCRIHQIFPPEENSPEMEMVAQGIEKHLKVEQRKFLMDMISRICSEGSQRTVAEALGLVTSPGGFTNECQRPTNYDDH